MICVSIIEKNPAKIVEIANDSEMAEIRIDLCELNESTVAEVFSKIGKPTIATCRPNLVDDVTRESLLKTAIKSGAKYVDVEIESSSDFKKSLMDFAKSYGCQTIISYHNYEKTPEDLQSIVDTCFSQGADIAKVATTANSGQDSARILALYAKYSNLVALAMGEKGQITRVANLCLGSPFSFASIDSEHISAAGQLAKSQMESILNVLK